jgi:hypothetical protein
MHLQKWQQENKMAGLPDAGGGEKEGSGSEIAE